MYEEDEEKREKEDKEIKRKKSNVILVINHIFHPVVTHMC
jgi:hypothetical protein